MQDLYVQSLPIAQVIADLAKEMRTDYYNLCNYYRLTLPADLGEGHITGIQFDSGFAMLNYDCIFYKDTRINFTYDQIHPMKFLHCYNGKVTHLFEGTDVAHRLDAFQNIVVASRRKNGHVLEFERDQEVKICSLEIDRKPFQHRIECWLEKESGILIKAINDLNASEQYYEKGTYSLAITNIINKLIKIDSLSLTTFLLKEGECYQLLSYQWLKFSKSSSRTILEKYELEMFFNFRRYISENIGETITVSKLSKTFYVSEKKIQYLFKSLANKTVSKYIQDYRLERSLELLSKADNNISEVVYKLGLKNRSYFSRKFKERYGLTPSEYVASTIDS